VDGLTLLKAVVMGIVEGLTEFIPVSSTGHLIITQNLINFTGRVENVFSIFIQLGAILAVVWLYRKKFLNVALSLKTQPESRRLVTNLVIGTLPAVVIGLPTESWIEAHLFKPYPVALALAIGGLLILVIERNYKYKGIADVDSIPWTKALGVGTLQVLAILFPGISRSGATIMGGMALGLSRMAATEFSFFLAIPAMLGASIIKLAGAWNLLCFKDLPVFFIGFVVSFFVALLVIKGLLRFVSHRSFVPFAWYRIAFGIVILIYGYYSGSF
jgi:undecaprenyl-diphosphatase